MGVGRALEAQHCRQPHVRKPSTVLHPLSACVLQVPLLKGLSDNDLLRVAGRMPERVYEDTDALIRYGERGDEMYLIRYGKVCAGFNACTVLPRTC
mgnify:CR=1 FL=1